jgi:hypothetical protein
MVLVEQDPDFSPYLQVPDTLAESLDRLSAEALGPSGTAAEKSQKMLDFFHGNFTYDTAPQAEGGKDAIEPFLFKSRQGHCEFFATAMTLWLRRNGIPARYVNGFLVEEYNRLGGYYVAREKDAHAWVEAYLPPAGWVTLDPTPPLSAKEKPPLIPTWLRDLYDLVRLKLYNMKERIVAGDIKELFVFMGLQVKLLILWLLASPLRLVITLAAAVLVYLVKWKKLVFLNFLKKREKEKRTPLDIPPDKKALAEVAEELEKLLARKRLARKGSVTHYEFSREIDSTALNDRQKKMLDDFYHAYCVLRYGKDTVDAADIEGMKEKLGEIKGALALTAKLRATGKK